MFGGVKNENQKNAKSFDINAVPSRLAFQPAQINYAERLGLRSAGNQRFLRNGLNNSQKGISLRQNNNVRTEMNEQIRNVNEGNSSKGNQYAFGNPLKMIKEYKSQNMRKSMQKNAQSYYDGSNASTGDYFINEEADRINKIMKEPIEQLIQNMDKLSRPFSSEFRLHFGNQPNKQKPPLSKQLKKERAMTAGGANKMIIQKGKNNSQGMKIAESAYHIVGGKRNGPSLVN